MLTSRHQSTKLTHTLISKRLFILPAVGSIIGSLIFNENNKLANQVSAGKYSNYQDANALLNLNKNNNSSYFQRSEPNYEGHVPLYTFEKILMLVGSSIGSYFHPERNEFIVALGESSAFPFVLNNLRHQMLSDPVGRQILKERPRITSTSLNLDYLKLLPKNTVGNTYIQWLEKEGVSPDTRVPVKYIDNEELAYIFQRYRECHDFYHSITGLPIIIEGEITVKVLEYMNIGIPMSGMGALFAPLRLKPSQKKRLWSTYYPWAIDSGLNSKPLINVYWEKILEKDVNEFRAEWGIEPPPDLRDMRKKHLQAIKEAKLKHKA